MDFPDILLPKQEGSRPLIRLFSFMTFYFSSFIMNHSELMWNRGTAVHSFHPQNILFSHVFALAHLQPSQVPCGNDRVLAVYREGSRAVVHHRSVVIFDTEMRQAVSSVHDEVVFRSSLNIFPHDSDKIVAVIRRLHVMEADFKGKSISKVK